MMSFKSYLLNEESSYLGHKVGDILSASQELERDMENLGSRHLNRLSEKLVNQIRKILHSHWGQKSQSHLEKLQRVAVAIKKTIEEKGDLKQILPSVVQELENISGQIGSKVNDLKAPEQKSGQKVNQEDLQVTKQDQNPPIQNLDSGPGVQNQPMPPAPQ